MKVNRTDRFGMPILCLQGTLDDSTRRELENLLKPALSAYASVVVDLSGVTAMDTEAARWLLATQRDLQRQKRRLRLLDPSPKADACLRSVTCPAA